MQGLFTGLCSCLIVIGQIETGNELKAAAKLGIYAELPMIARLMNVSPKPAPLVSFKLTRTDNRGFHGVVLVGDRGPQDIACHLLPSSDYEVMAPQGRVRHNFDIHTVRYQLCIYRGFPVRQP